MRLTDEQTTEEEIGDFKCKFIWCYKCYKTGLNADTLPDLWESSGRLDHLCATDRWERLRLEVWGHDIKSGINEEGKTHLWFGGDYKKLKPDHMDDEFGSNIGFTKWKTVWVKDQSVVDTTNIKAGCSTV